MFKYNSIFTFKSNSLFTRKSNSIFTVTEEFFGINLEIFITLFTNLFFGK